MNKIKIGMIGCGKQAHKHIMGLCRIPGVEVVLGDVNTLAARELGEKQGLPWVDDPEKIMNDPSIQAVCICTPTPSHIPLINQAIEAEKDFFLRETFVRKPG